MWVAAAYGSTHKDWKCFDTQREAKARVLAWEAATGKRGVWFYVGTTSEADQSAREAICGDESTKVAPSYTDEVLGRQKGGNARE